MTLLAFKSKRLAAHKRIPVVRPVWPHAHSHLTSLSSATLLDTSRQDRDQTMDYGIDGIGFHLSAPHTTQQSFYKWFATGLAALSMASIIIVFSS